MKNKLIIFTLLLIAIFSTTTACGSRRHRHRYHHSGHSHTGHNHNSHGVFRPPYQPQQEFTYPPERRTTTTTPEPVIDVSWLQLSCEQGLCASTGNYPQREVDTAVLNLRELLGKNSNVRLPINSRVKEYFFTPNKAALGVEIDNATGCEQNTTNSSPLAGYNIWGKPFIVVNVPNLRQVVRTSECRTNVFTLCSFDGDGSLCMQTHRTQELLVLPVKRGYFYPEDFSIQSFSVQNGCQCTPLKQVNFVDIFKFS